MVPPWASTSSLTVANPKPVRCGSVDRKGENTGKLDGNPGPSSSIVIKTDFSIPEDLLPVEADEGQIGQVTNNLILNATHAMPEGGILEIRSENVILSADNEFSLPAGPYLKTSFRDHGVGIGPDHLPKVFDPYFSTK